MKSEENEECHVPTSVNLEHLVIKLFSPSIFIAILSKKITSYVALIIQVKYMTIYCSPYTILYKQYFLILYVIL